MKDIVELNKIIKTGVVILPTDSIYGFSCLPSQIDSIERIRKLKNRNEPDFILLDTDITRIIKCFKNDFTKNIIKEMLIEKLWPGPITVISEKSNDFPYKFLKNISTVAIRYPNDEFLENIIKSTGSSIVSTSINISGEKEINKYEDIVNTWGDKVDLVMKREIGSGYPSTIIKVNDDQRTIDPVRITSKSDGIMLKMNKLAELCR